LAFGTTFDYCEIKQLIDNIVQPLKTEVIMTLIKRNNSVPAWTNLFDDFLNRNWYDWESHNFSKTNTTLPSVNIKENEEGFLVEMAAPGMEKEDFKVEVNNGYLTISSEKQQENKTEDKKERYTKQEFSYESFSRLFTLPTSADSEKIAARYEKGILTVAIPKREEAKPKPLKQIEIA
jgi:HSP20 family protein